MLRNRHVDLRYGQEIYFFPKVFTLVAVTVKTLTQKRQVFCPCGFSSHGHENDQSPPTAPPVLLQPLHGVLMRNLFSLRCFMGSVNLKLRYVPSLLSYSYITPSSDVILNTYQNLCFVSFHIFLKMVNVTQKQPENVE